MRLRGRVDRIDRTPDGKRAWVIDYKSGTIIEFDPTQKIFTRPTDRRTEDYITGRYG